MAYRKWTEEEVEYLKNQYGKLSGAEISAKIGRSASTISAKARKLGLSGRTDIWSGEDVKFLQENYLNLGAKETAHSLGRTLSSVHSKILEVGGGAPSTGPRIDWTVGDTKYLQESYSRLTWEEMEKYLGRTKAAIFDKAQTLGLKRYTDPYLFFEEWTEESAYVIGFFAADGWISKRGPESIRIGFGQKDPDILYKISEVIGVGKVYPKANGMHRYYVQSVRAYIRLCEIFGGDVCRKSRRIEWPTVPREYMRHFLRGAYDGDGSLILRQDDLWETSYTTSSKVFIDALVRNILQETGIRMRAEKNKINVYHARCTGIKAVCLADWLYNPCAIALERKESRARKMYTTLGGYAHESSLTPKMQELFPHILDTYTFVG